MQRLFYLYHSLYTLFSNFICSFTNCLLNPLTFPALLQIIAPHSLANADLTFHPHVTQSIMVLRILTNYISVKFNCKVLWSILMLLWLFLERVQGGSDGIHWIWFSKVNSWESEGRKTTSSVWEEKGKCACEGVHMVNYMTERGWKENHELMWCHGRGRKTPMFLDLGKADLQKYPLKWGVVFNDYFERNVRRELKNNYARVCVSKLIV